MAILINNTGNKVVPNIAARNALVRRFNGMQVIVTDAIADILVGGSFQATYIWNTTLSQWLMTHKNASDVLEFATETQVIANGKVTANFTPQSGNVSYAIVLDADGLEQASVLTTAVANEISLGTNSYDGMRLVFSYAYGAVQAAITNTAGVQSATPVAW